MIHGICFDLDGVYFINGKSNFIKNLSEFGVSESEAKRVFLQSFQMNSLYKLGQMTDEEFWSWALEEWKLKMSIPEIINLLIQGYEFNQPAVEYVKNVRNAGYKTIVCSNNFPARIEGLQKRFGFLNDFDVVVLSYEIGFTKPDKEIFEALIIKSHLKPEEIVYSDDDETKMTGAKELGIKTVLYTTFEKYLQELKLLGVNANKV